MDAKIEQCISSFYNQFNLDPSNWFVLSDLLELPIDWKHNLNVLNAQLKYWDILISSVFTESFQCSKTTKLHQVQIQIQKTAWIKS